MVQLCCVAVSFVISRFYVPLNQFVNTGVLYFIAVGVLASFVGRFSLYVGMERVGASIAAPLSQTKPLFSAIAAILILSETLISGSGKTAVINHLAYREGQLLDQTGYPLRIRSIFAGRVILEGDGRLYELRRRSVLE